MSEWIKAKKNEILKKKKKIVGKKKLFIVPTHGHIVRTFKTQKYPFILEQLKEFLVCVHTYRFACLWNGKGSCIRNPKIENQKERKEEE